MILETKRLVLRAWEATDADALFALASDPEVGPAAGWPVHRSVKESKKVIESVFSAPETYAICLKPLEDLIGCIGLKSSNPEIAAASAGDLEIGYWMGRAYWGCGYATEALHALVDHALLELNCPTLWCGHYEGNERSRRVMLKCGFEFAEKHSDVLRGVFDDSTTELFYRLKGPAAR